MAVLFQHAQYRIRILGTHHQQTVDTLLRHHRQIGALFFLVIPGVAEDQGIPLLETLLLDRFDDLGLSHSDLVAEGNLALYEAILAYPETQTSTDLSDFEAFLDKEVYDSLQEALNIEIGSNRVSNHLADQVNALNDASTELAKELGREATLEELCERLALSTDEVKELMKISIDALTVIQSDDELKK